MYRHCKTETVTKPPIAQLEERKTVMVTAYLEVAGSTPARGIRFSFFTEGPYTPPLLPRGLPILWVRTKLKALNPCLVISIKFL